MQYYFIYYIKCIIIYDELKTKKNKKLFMAKIKIILQKVIK